MRTFVEVYLC